MPEPSGTFSPCQEDSRPFVSAALPVTIDPMAGVNRPSPQRVRRGLLAAVVLLGGWAWLTSCGRDADAAATDATVLDLRLGRLVLEPEVLTAPAGDLRLRVTNDDPEMVHDLVVLGKGTRPLAPGESQTIDIPDVAVGRYGMWCDIPGHAAAGQTGYLMVAAATEPSTTAS